MGANPIRKTVEDEQVQTMAQEALDQLDEIEGLDEAVEEVIGVIQEEEIQAEEQKRKSRKNPLQAFYERGEPSPRPIVKPPVIKQMPSYEPPTPAQIYSQNLCNNFGGR